MRGYEMRISDWSSDGCSSDLSFVHKTSSARLALPSFIIVARFAGLPLQIGRHFIRVADDKSVRRRGNAAVVKGPLVEPTENLLAHHAADHVHGGAVSVSRLFADGNFTAAVRCTFAFCGQYTS